MNSFHFYSSISSISYQKLRGHSKDIDCFMRESSKDGGKYKTHYLKYERIEKNLDHSWKYKIKNNFDIYISGHQNIKN